MILKYLAFFVNGVTDPVIIMGPKEDVIQHADMVRYTQYRVPDCGGFIKYEPENDKETPNFFGESYSTNTKTPEDTVLVEALIKAFNENEWLILFETNRYVKNYPMIYIIPKADADEISVYGMEVFGITRVSKDDAIAALNEWVEDDSINDDTVFKLKEKSK